MELQERKLYLGEAGDEVRLLHSKLRLLGLDIPAEERQAGLFGQVTHQAVLDLQAKLGVAVSGEVDEVVARRLNRDLAGAGQFTLQGQVRSAAGAPAAGLVVELFDKTLGGETWLGRAETDSAGRDEIHYPTDKFDKPLADLLVRVTQADGTVLEAQHPAILFAAPPVAVQDITLATAALPQPSAYEQLVGQIKPPLGDTPLADLQPADVEYLAGKAGAEPQQIEWLVQSQTLSQATGLPPGALYAWSRENLAAEFVNITNDHFSRRSSSAWAKKADAVFRISFARLSSRFSRLSALSSSSSELVRPGRRPSSTSAR
jgi:hypothetical protein